jgi:hypothetical protein
MSGSKVEKLTLQHGAAPPKVRPSGSAAAAKPVKFSPDTPAVIPGASARVPFVPATPQADPPLVQGIDLTGRPKIIIAAGRGKTGKTLLLRWLTERSLAASGAVMLADIDRTNASFSTFFDDVAQPNTDVPAGILRWMQGFLDHCIRHRQSAIIDVGGGDTTMREMAAEMPGFATHLEAEGMSLVPFFVVGTQPDDLAPLATLTARGFAPAAQAMVLNEWAMDAGLSRDTAFNRIIASPTFTAHIGGMVPIWMPRLHAADAVDAHRSSFAAAAAGLTNPPLGFFDRSRVQHWLATMERRFEGVGSWLP